MAVAKKPKKTESKDESGEALRRYEQIFENITCFTDAIANSEEAISKARDKVNEAKSRLDEAKSQLADLESIQDGNKLALYRYLHPKTGEIMPLFDRMAPADEEVHGLNSDEWRKEPIAALKLSLPSLKTLTDSDIVLVGQLQDIVLANRETWWEKLEGLSLGAASAIVDRLNDFIFERTKK